MTDAREQRPDQTIRRRYVGGDMCVGVAIGAAIGGVLGNLALGMGPGIAIGVALGLVGAKRAEVRSKDQGRHVRRRAP